jgi:formylglycine-generating enzyme required for sulfatase activity
MAGNGRRLECRFAARLAISVTIACLLGVVCGGELSFAGWAEPGFVGDAGVRLQSVSVSRAVRTVASTVSSLESSASMADSRNLVCEAVFSGSFPVLSKLAELKVSIDEFKAQNKPELAQTLYDNWRRKVDEARLGGIDLGGLGFLIEEAKAGRETERQFKEDHEKRVREVEERELVTGRRTVFHPIEPGKFMMGQVGKQIETEITRPFQMAATQTTQVVWRKVVSRAKEKFPGKYDALNADPSNFKGDLNPVEQVSYEDIQLWIQALNELAQAGDSVVQEAMPGHQPGEIIRLPTEAEWEFVVRVRGTANGVYHFGDGEADLERHGWFNANSGQTTHPVATRGPLVIDGQEFYDLHGNVWEWTQDWYDSTLKGGKDPRGPSTGSGRVVRGGCWYGSARDLRSGHRGGWGPGGRSSGVGFRLARALP